MSQDFSTYQWNTFWKQFLRFAPVLSKHRLWVSFLLYGATVPIDVLTQPVPVSPTIKLPSVKREAGQAKSLWDPGTTVDQGLCPGLKPQNLC